MVCDAVFHLFKAKYDLPCSRYANMDYIFASAVKSMELLLVAISYDIVCQWFVNIFGRMTMWPQELQMREGLSLRPLIPKFHELAHLEKLHEQYSFNLAEGVGLSDGECPERLWSSHNALYSSTRTTGPGTRDDILDDNFGQWNWLKYSSMGKFSGLSCMTINMKCLLSREDVAAKIQSCDFQKKGAEGSSSRLFKTTVSEYCCELGANVLCVGRRWFS